jgi:cytoplasmic FMR1 interacting protein
MIKGLAGVMMKEDSLLSPIIRSSIHDEVQEFIQIQLRDPIRHTTKKKKKELRK